MVREIQPNCGHLNLYIIEAKSVMKFVAIICGLCSKNCCEIVIKIATEVAVKIMSKIAAKIVTEIAMENCHKNCMMAA